MCWEDVQTGEKGECTTEKDIRSFFERTAGAYYVGHNLLKFDAPTLVRIISGVDLGVYNCIDTLVMSTLYSPSIDGGHSLEAWGKRLKKPKIEFSDWSRLTQEMIRYCHQDVSVTRELFVKLMKLLISLGFTEQSLWIQHRITDIVERQRKNGFRFDGPRAIELYTHLRHREEELQDEIRRVFPDERVLVAVRPMFTKTGRPTAIFEKDKQRYFLEEDHASGSYRAFEDVPFNVGSPKQRVEKLVELGWEPKEFTPAGNPKPFDKGKLSPSLEQFLETHPVPEVELIAKWMSINGRANMINTWLEAWNENTGCIHGKLFVADTLRFRHQAPNTANIPAVRLDEGGAPRLGMDGYYTYESRDLWTARPGRVLVGTDAAGLELRMLAHYLNRPEFTQQVVEGDPHQYNADVVGITRPQAKTLIYAIMYGAGPPKIAGTLGVPVKEAAYIRTMFLERLGIGPLMEECKTEQASGRIELIDGSQIVCPSPHAALNYKLQGGGARVMMLACAILEMWIKKQGLDSLKVGDVHDEWIYDVFPDHAERHSDLSVRAIQKAGQLLKLNVPLDGKALIGRSWAVVH